YKFVESIKFPALASISFKPIATLKPLWMVVSIGLVSSFVFIDHGIESRVNKRVVIAENSALDRNPLTEKCFYSPTDPVDSKPCIIGNKNNIKAIIIGDSHADALSAGVLSAFNLSNDGVVAYLRWSCPFILGVKNKHYPIYNCTESNYKEFKEVTTKYKNIPVFVINRTSSYIWGQSEKARITDNNSPGVYFTKPYNAVNDTLLNEFTNKYLDTICKLEKTNPVFITTPTPEMLFNVPKTIAKLSLLKDKEENIVLPKDNYIKRNKYVLNLMDKAHKECGATILDTSKYLCDDKACYGSIKGHPLYYDGDHLSVYGSKFLTPLFKSALNNHNRNLNGERS
ncbi:SGNH hydrolase domain-containing protein, partial [Photobacterium carnosum]